MDFFSNDGRRLETLADWRNHSGPVSARDWAEGRSARELARAWIEGNAATQVTSLLTSAPALGGLVLDRGIVDKQTRFDDTGAGPRHHDLLVIGRAPSGTVVIGVEGKADEPFDEPLDAWVMRAEARGERSRAPERLDRLTTRSSARAWTRIRCWHRCAISCCRRSPGRSPTRASTMPPVRYCSSTSSRPRGPTMSCIAATPGISRRSSGG